MARTYKILSDLLSDLWTWVWKNTIINRTVSLEKTDFNIYEHEQTCIFFLWTWADMHFFEWYYMNSNICKTSKHIYGWSVPMSIVADSANDGIRPYFTIIHVIVLRSYFSMYSRKRSCLFDLGNKTVKNNIPQVEENDALNGWKQWHSVALIRHFRNV
jgi:hypothetical protein